MVPPGRARPAVCAGPVAGDQHHGETRGTGL